MGVSIGQAKQQFAVIVEGLHKDSGLLSQFAVWLDLKLSEYKLQGGMRLDSHEVVSHPDWMQGVKCRCLQNMSSRIQKLSSDSGFGNTAWMFPLIDQDGITTKQYVAGQSDEVGPNAVHHDRRSADALHGGDVDRSNLENIRVNGNTRQKRDDRNLFQTATGGLNKNSKAQPESTASTFLSSLAIAASIEKPPESSPHPGMTLPVRTMESSPLVEVTENGENPEASLNYDIGDYMLESRSDEEGNEVNDTLDDEYLEDLEDEDEKMPRIISVTSVEPDTPICFPTGFRPSQKGKRRHSYQSSFQLSKKTRIVRNYSREFKLRVVGHCLKHGNRSASITFDVPKTNVQRWTNRVTKSSPECGIPSKAGLGNQLQKAEELLVAWVNETYNESGSPTITELQNMASSIFEDVHPAFEPAYVWILHFLYRYKLAKLVELPTDLENALGETVGETDDVY